MLQLATILCTLAFLWLVASALRAGAPSIYRRVLVALRLDPPA